jgi:tetratricopeptide (TPR) repeat protein
MGAFTVLYGKTKIKIFYSLGFYFSYAKVSAIFLLPVWVGNEIFQLYFGGYTQIAYVAHLGGLISGAALGYINLRLFRRLDEKVFEEDPKEKIPAILEEALEAVAKLDMDSARPLLEKVLEIDPNNRDALTHLFNIDKLNPQSEQYSKSASRLLRHLSNDSDAHEELYNSYHEYLHISKRPKLDRDLSFSIASVFSAHGYLQEAEKIMAAFLKNSPSFQKLPTGILNLARAYINMGESKKAEKCLRIICKRYPQSPESQIADRLLNDSN